MMEMAIKEIREETVMDKVHQLIIKENKRAPKTTILNNNLIIAQKMEQQTKNPKINNRPKHKNQLLRLNLQHSPVKINNKKRQYRNKLKIKEKSKNNLN